MNAETNIFKFSRSAGSKLQHRLFIGNPGVGKSTLANCIAKTLLFRSGMYIGKGMTYQLEENEHDGISYLETTGLADINMLRKAAKTITEGLKKGGCYQIFFVVTLEAGRIGAADIATIRIILEKATDITSYSLIINKLSKHAYDKLHQDNKEELKHLLSEFYFQIGNKRDPPKPLLLLEDDTLEDTKNQFKKLSNLDEFVSEAPYVNVNPDNVYDIPDDYDSFENFTNLMREELNQLRSDKEGMKKQSILTEERYRKSADEKVKKLFLRFYLLSVFFFFVFSTKKMI